LRHKSGENVRWRFSALRGWICLAICLSLASCSFWESSKPVSKVPVFLLTQAAPDGKSIEAVVPSSLVEQTGDLEKVMKSLPPDSKFTIARFGKTLGRFQTNTLNTSDVLGAIAVFKLKTAIDTNNAIWRERSLVIMPTAQLEAQTDSQVAAQAGNDPTNSSGNQTNQTNQSYQLTCPAKIQTSIITQSRPLFTKLGVDESLLDKISIASIVCLDLDLDNQPEIVTGLRVDNPDRPSSIDPQAWQKFLALPANQRQEFSMLVILRQSGADWQAEPILTHIRALAFIGDSISSYVLFGAQDLDRDSRAELIVQAISLDTIDAQVITSVSNQTNQSNQLQWRNYYQPDRSLNIVQ